VKWPKSIFDIFNNKNLPFGDRYYGPYNKLLHYALMDDSFTFFVSPQRLVHEDPFPREAVYPELCLVVYNQDCNPFLFAMIKDDSWATKPYTCLRADAQMREQHGHFMLDHPIPPNRLYGLSLLGTSLRVYCYDKDTNTLTPDLVDCPNANHILPCDLLEGEWNIDILSPDGLKKMQEIVAYIKAEAAK
jgi:hypothetical protein